MKVKDYLSPIPWETDRDVDGGRDDRCHVKGGVPDGTVWESGLRFSRSQNEVLVYCSTK